MRRQSVNRYQMALDDADGPLEGTVTFGFAVAGEPSVGGIVEDVNRKFARAETIKKFRLIDQLLDPEDEELTPTMKLKRKVVNKKYINLIEEMY